ncbi:hypothetical protein CEXT_94141 [Caerostris extrusa]|uniref:Uncharacterized protein n=1 Tax=Caerostris extrusa TaxID=172846 RepID=A0AAV4WZP3_CAEEX|nr:hypothetical protein CEXT_94141 [Caerostris extrusa]
MCRLNYLACAERPLKEKLSFPNSVCPVKKINTLVAKACAERPLKEKLSFPNSVCPDEKINTLVAKRKAFTVASHYGIMTENCDINGFLCMFVVMRLLHSHMRDERNERIIYEVNRKW